MNLFAIAGISCGIFCTILALVALIFGKVKIHRILALFNISVAIWGYGSFIAGISTTESAALFGWRFAQTGGIFIAVFFYHMICVHSGLQRRIPLRITYTWGSFFLYFCIFTDFLFAKTRFIYDVYYNDATWFYGVLVFSWTLIVCISFFEGLRFLPKAKGTKRIQTVYIIFGFLIGFIGGASTLIPMFNIRFIPYGNFTIPIYCLIATYAILRHHLLDIEIIVKRTLVFAGLLAFVLGAIVLSSSIIQEVLGNIIGLPKVFTYLLSALAVIALYEPVKKFLTNITNKYLFQKKYDYKQILKAFLDEVITVLDLDKIVAGTIDFLDRIFHPERSAVLLLNDEKDKFVTYGKSGYDKDIGLEGSSKIITHLKGAKGILSIEDEKTLKTNGQLKAEMDTFKASLAIPLIASDGLLGVVLLGKKKSDELYSNEDIGILTDLARTEAISISNSRTHAKLLESQEKEYQSEHMVSLAYMVINLSHEIRNPLNIIKTSADVGLQNLEMDFKDFKLDKKHKESLDIINEKFNDISKTSKKSSDMLTAILESMKINKSEFTPLDVRFIIEEVIKRTGPDLAQTSIKIENNVPQDFTKPKGDLVTIEQALFNIVHNAVQAIIRSKKGDKIVISVRELDDALCIDIEDNGPGIPKKDIKRIFEPFYTTKDNLFKYATGQSRGYGLGLMLVHQIITAHEGSVTVESEEGKGTKFTVTLPKPKA